MSTRAAVSVQATQQPRPTPLRPQPLARPPGPWSRIQLLIDLRCAELANALGLTWRLTSLRRILTVAVVALCAAVPAAGYAFARIFALLSVDVPAPALLLPLMTSLAFMSGLGLFFAEALGRYRNAVSGHPNRAYFRALDIPAALVHTVYVVPRLVGAAGFWVLLGAGAIAGLVSVQDHSDWLPVALAGMILQPMLWMTGTLLISLRLAGNSVDVGARFSTGVACAALAGTCAGLVVSWIIIPRLPRGGTIPSASADVPGQDLGATPAVLLAILILVLALLCGNEMRRLRSRSFRLDGADATHRSLRLGRSAGWYWFRLMLRQRRRSWRKRVEDRLGWALTGAACALGAGRLSGAVERSGLDFLPPAAAAHIMLAAGFGGALLGLACAETTLGDLGRQVHGKTLRAALELGAPLRVAVTVHVTALLAPTVLLGLLASAVASLLLGRVEPVPLVVAVGACAGSIIAERLFPPPRTVDGGAGESLVTAMAALILGSLPVVWLAVAPALAVWFTPFFAAALLGGALWCAHRNLTVL